MFDAKSIKEKMERIANTSDRIKAKMELEVNIAQIRSIIAKVDKDLKSKEGKCEIIGLKIVDEDYADLCLVFESPLSGITYMAISAETCFTKPVTKKGDEPQGYLSMILRNKNLHKLRYKKENIELKSFMEGVL